jgi:hypothetical protein
MRPPVRSAMVFLNLRAQCCHCTAAVGVLKWYLAQNWAQKLSVVLRWANFVGRPVLDWAGRCRRARGPELWRTESVVSIIGRRPAESTWTWPLSFSLSVLSTTTLYWAADWLCWHFWSFRLILRWITTFALCSQSPLHLHHFRLTRGVPKNTWLQRHLADWNAIWQYFASIQLLFILSILT